MQGLKDVTNNVHYENFRCQKLAGVSGVSSPDPKKFQAPSRYAGREGGRDRRREGGRD